MALPWQHRLRTVLLIYGALNAVLYAGLLPLWEGFDEPFHYAYVEQLWRQRSLPRLGPSILTAEIWDSLPLAPGSHLVHRNIPIVIPFNDYFDRPEASRHDLRRRLEALDPHRAAEPGGSPNYEAQQPPLAYAILAPFDAALSALPLIWRILGLRLVAVLLATIATGLLTVRLAEQLGLSPAWRLSALFLVLSSQMFYATAAHVANDWLALPLLALLLSTAISLWEHPGFPTALRLFWILAAGLLTKVYFLALAPPALLLVGYLCRTRKLPSRPALLASLPLALAVPWYVRNVVLYHDLTGMMHSAGGIPFRELLRTVFHLPWPRILANSATTGLWTGNNSDTPFSSKTIHFMVLLLLAAGVMYLLAAVRNSWPSRERLLYAWLACFAAGLLYSVVLMFWSAKGAQVTIPPWYTQLLLAPGMCLVMLGLSRGGRTGRIVHILMLCCWSYVISATYVAKLIPLYAGYTGERIRLLELVRWYTHSWDRIHRTLADTALLPPSLIWVLAALVIALALSMAVVLSAWNFRQRPQ